VKGQSPWSPTIYARRIGARVWPLILTVVFAFVVAAVLLRAMGPFNREHPWHAS